MAYVENNVTYNHASIESPIEIGWKRHKYLSIDLESRKGRERYVDILGNENDFLKLLKHWNKNTVLANHLYAPID